MDENIKYEKLRNIIKLYLPEDVSVDYIDIKSHLINDLNINSANLVDIVLDVEDEFDIMLENDDMDTMQTVEDALQIIDSKIANKNS
ncbi:phosphopantetheine-binding protein [Pseudozobellia sp. WGM2]|uniref:phosphopantetheine-binding protein n=1 Tax=Pseudozobellia sp. WGM2 TaxID=2787625 RepID=UPI001AE05470|nr:phosphopantetheine-binding protein [Pseudozobellia sp. WGM2]